MGWWGIAGALLMSFFIGMVISRNVWKWKVCRKLGLPSCVDDAILWLILQRIKGHAVRELNDIWKNGEKDATPK